jgi:hypothetical protein
VAALVVVVLAEAVALADIELPQELLVVEVLLKLL